jgi:hypothetical protein
MFDTVPDGWIAEFASDLTSKPKPARDLKTRRSDRPAPADQLGPADRLPGGRSSHYVTSRYSTADDPSDAGGPAAGERVALLVGPFPTWQQAHLWVDTAQDVLLARGHLDAAFSVRVTRMWTSPATERPGELNDVLAVRLEKF